MRSRRCRQAANRLSVIEVSWALAAASIFCLPALSETLSEHQKADSTSAKSANIAAARQINGTTAPSSRKTQSNAQATAKAVNQVPGVKVAPSDVQPPEAAPIKGFHPIKKILQPIEDLEGMTVKLESQIVKLEGPIAALNPPMVHLQTKMTSVNGTMGQMQEQLNGVDNQMHGVRSDLAKMRAEISGLKAPILAIQKPLISVSEPLEAVETQLNIVLGAIVAAAIAIVIGTPMAAIVLYRYRDKLFPGKVPTGSPPEREKVLQK